MDRYTCKICGSEFESDKSAKYCPPPKDCRRIAKNKQNTKYRRRKGIKPRKKGMNWKPKETQCKCGKWYRKNSPAQKYCTPVYGEALRKAKAVNDEPITPVKWSPDDFNQAKYRKQMRELKQPNGRKCQDCGKPLTGSYRQVCKTCKAKRDERFSNHAVDGDWIYETTIDQMRY